MLFAWVAPYENVTLKQLLQFVVAVGSFALYTLHLPQS